MDKIGFFYRVLSRYTLLIMFEDLSFLPNKKKVKDWISLVVCGNAIGTHKISCILVGKPKCLACIKNHEWSLKYFSQCKAWMDIETCLK